MVVFLIKSGKARHSKISSTVHTKDVVVNGCIPKDRFGTDYAFVNEGQSKPISYMTLDEFEEIFDTEEIKEMWMNGTLVYENVINGWGEKRINYPIFRKEIYLKYGREETLGLRRKGV